MGIDGGDLGTVAGAVIGGGLIAVAGGGLGAVIAGSTLGAVGGHHVAEPNHYKPIYQNNQYK